MSTLSVVIPVCDERPEDLATTLDALAAELPGSGWADPELVLVDDGSAQAVTAPCLPGLACRVIRQPNRGRFEARRTGISTAAGEYVLLLDSRVALRPGGLRFVATRVGAGDHVWNGHCEMANPEAPYARFWNAIVHAAWSDYLDTPRTTSFGLDEYDRFPTGTGHFLAPRTWLAEALDGFDSHYADTRNSSDDTHLLRAIAARERIHISPGFASSYRNREALVPFLRHSVHRGTTFFDGFARAGARWRPVALGAMPGSLLGAAFAVRRPRTALAAAVSASALAGVAVRVRRRPFAEARAVATLLVPFAAAFVTGVWRGGWLAARARLRRP